jgi:hypothetical protein
LDERKHAIRFAANLFTDAQVYFVENENTIDAFVSCTPRGVWLLANAIEDLFVEFPLLESAKEAFLLDIQTLITRVSQEFLDELDDLRMNMEEDGVPLESEPGFYWRRNTLAH